MRSGFPGLRTSAQRISAIVGVALALLAAAWYFWLGTPWTIRIPRDWRLVTNYAGTESYADSTTGDFPEKDELDTYERSIHVINASDWPHSVVLQDRYAVRDLKTRAVTFEYVLQETVDPKTGAWAGPTHEGEIVVFPRDVEKRTYTMSSNYLKRIPLSFAGQQEIDGLPTYIFSYRGPAEYSEAYGGTAEFPGVRIPPGQEIRCADDQFYYRVWVEPRTGMQVKLEEGCLSGNYFYDIATNKRLAAVDKFSGVMAGEDLLRRVAEVYRARTKYTWAAIYFPALLLLSALALLGWALSPRKGRVAE